MLAEALHNYKVIMFMISQW